LNTLMTTMPASATGLRARAAPLWAAAAAVLAAMPLGMVVAHRSSPAFLVLAAALALAAAGAERRGDEILARARAALARPPGRVALLFLGWSILSLSWSAFPATSAWALGEFWLPVAAGFLLAVTLPDRMPRWGLPLVLGALAVSCLLVLIELRTGLAWRRDLGLRAATFVFNRPVLTVLVAIVPLGAALLSRGRLPAAAAAGLVALAGFTITRSESGAAELGLAVAGLVGVGAFLAPRLVNHLGRLAFVAVLALAPVLGTLGDRLIPPALHQDLADSHSRDRVNIWTSFGAAIREQPLVGGGFGVSPRMAETPVAGRVPDDRRVLLGVGHPHSAAVQVWAELGAVGAVLAALLLWLVLRALAALPRRRHAAALTLVAVVAAVSLVGHGAWQGWWPAAIAAACVWLRAYPPEETSR
jgi:O-Antigen ligase